MSSKISNNDSCDEQVTVEELNSIKEKMEINRKRLCDYEDEIREDRRDLINKIKEQEELCGDECLKNLEEHLKTCDGGYEKDDPNYGKMYYKCERSSVCYNCDLYNNENNGRCSHYYDIKYLNEQLENLEEYRDDLKDRILDLEVDYDRKLAIKEGRLEQYDEDLWDYFA